MSLAATDRPAHRQVSQEALPSSTPRRSAGASPRKARNRWHQSTYACSVRIEYCIARMVRTRVFGSGTSPAARANPGPTGSPTAGGLERARIGWSDGRRPTGARLPSTYPNQSLSGRTVTHINEQRLQGSDELPTLPVGELMRGHHLLKVAWPSPATGTPDAAPSGSLRPGESTRGASSPPRRAGPGPTGSAVPVGGGNHLAARCGGWHATAGGLG